MSSDITAVYKWVVDDVIARLKPEFVQEGVDESVLLELRRRWEEKLLSSGAVGNQRLEGDGSSQSQSRAGGAAAPSGQAGASAPGASQPTVKDDPTPNLAPYPHLAAMQLPHGAAMQQSAAMVAALAKRKAPEGGFHPTGGMVPGALDHIPQADGPGDDEADGGEDAGDDGEQLQAVEEESEEDLDDVQVSDDDEEADANVANIIAAQFAKVTRSKNKWKCQLKYGIMHLNGRDSLFQNATGEFYFN